MTTFIHFDGVLRSSTETVVAGLDASFLSGVGLFETIRVCGGRIQLLKEHLSRLTVSASVLSIGLPPAFYAAQSSIEELLEANRLDDAKVRLSVSGLNGLGGREHGHVLISAESFLGYPRDLYESGMSVVTATYTQNPDNPLSGHKTLSYFDRILALREAKNVGAGEALWFTATPKYLAEGSISNVFVVDQEGNVVTPVVSMTENSSRRLCLPGVTREAIIKIASRNNAVFQKLCTYDEILQAREVFLTNSLMGVMPVTMLDGKKIGHGRPGSLTGALSDAYKRYVAK